MERRPSSSVFFWFHVVRCPVMVSILNGQQPHPSSKKKNKKSRTHIFIFLGNLQVKIDRKLGKLDLFLDRSAPIGNLGVKFGLLGNLFADLKNLPIAKFFLKKLEPPGRTSCYAMTVRGPLGSCGPNTKDDRKYELRGRSTLKCKLDFISGVFTSL